MLGANVTNLKAISARNRLLGGDIAGALCGCLTLLDLENKVHMESSLQSHCQDRSKFIAG